MLAILILATAQAIQADVIRVTGSVATQKKVPLPGVYVIDVERNRTLAVTDEDGKFAVNAYSDGTLSFSMLGFKKTTVKIKGRKHIDAVLEEEDIELNEISISAKRITDKVIPEPTDIEVHGNYFHIKTRIRVPQEMFSSDTRLVVQPVLTNVTRDSQTLMRPLVFDAREYHTTQERMYDFDIQNDPLAPYIIVRNDSTRNKSQRNDIISYRDSVYVEDMQNEFTCDIFMAIEDYQRILYRDTTVIARGTVNPLRFLDYSFGASDITDSLYYPKAEMQLRDSKGEINLHFPVGKSKLDLTDTHNRKEMEQLHAQLQTIAANPDATLQAFRIMGTASPDGRYDRNLQLARDRMRSALDYIVGQLDNDTRKHMKVEADAQVAPWQAVADLLAADNHPEEAAQVKEIIARYSRIDDQSNRMRRLPSYRTLLNTEYLPRLRRVEYELNYSIYRFLTIEEIEQLYEKDYHQLSRYEFFRLYRNETDPARRERLCRQALEVYPRFMVAANDLQACLIRRGNPDAGLLEPFAGEKAPATLNANQMIALLDAGRFESADSLNAFVPETDRTKLLKAVTSALNGRYEEAYPAIAQTGTRNEVLMLLAMKRNAEAMQMCENLPMDDAVNLYIQAICLNRNDRPEEAYEKLKKAFEMQPSLKRTALVDGDVNDLLPKDEQQDMP